VSPTISTPSLRPDARGAPLADFIDTLHVTHTYARGYKGCPATIGYRTYIPRSNFLEEKFNRRLIIEESSSKNDRKIDFSECIFLRESSIQNIAAILQCCCNIAAILQCFLQYCCNVLCLILYTLCNPFNLSSIFASKNIDQINRRRKNQESRASGEFSIEERSPIPSFVNLSSGDGVAAVRDTPYTYPRHGIHVTRY